MDKAAEAVKNAIMNGIDLIREGAGIDITSATFIIQICATIVLFLFVRYKLWNIVTGFLEKRVQSVITELQKKEQAEAELVELKAESSHIIDDAKQEALELVSNAKKVATIEQERIVNNAKQEANVILDLYKQLDGLDAPEKIYVIKIPILQTYAIRKKLEEFVGE